MKCHAHANTMINIKDLQEIVPGALGLCKKLNKGGTYLDIKIINALAELKIECKRHENCNAECSLYIQDSKDIHDGCFVSNYLQPEDYEIDTLVEVKNAEKVIKIH